MQFETELVEIPCERVVYTERIRSVRAHQMLLLQSRRGISRRALMQSRMRAAGKGVAWYHNVESYVTMSRERPTLLLGGGVTLMAQTSTVWPVRQELVVAN